MITRQNFGSGSSREHAVWALEGLGIEALIGTSFADIFYNNCFQNGMLPIVLSEENIKNLTDKAQRDPEGYEATIDLENRTITDNYGLNVTFEVDAFTTCSILSLLISGLEENPQLPSLNTRAETPLFFVATLPVTSPLVKLTRLFLFSCTRNSV